MRYRTVIESDYVTQTIDNNSTIFPRLRDVVDGWSWRLSREPQNIGGNIQGNTYILKSVDFTNTTGVLST